jgi:hypothetical protein
MLSMAAHPLMCLLEMQVRLPFFPRAREMVVVVDMACSGCEAAHASFFESQALTGSCLTLFMIPSRIKVCKRWSPTLSVIAGSQKKLATLLIDVGPYLR